MKKTLSPFRTLRAGFSLVEAMVTTGILGLVTVGTLGFFVQSMNIFSYDSGKIMVNRDIRKFTSEMTDNATYANYFLIFPAFDNRTVSQNVTDPVTGAVTSVTSDTSVNDGLSGDFLVLVYKDDADPNKTSRLVGYYRAVSSSDVNAEGPVRKFDVSFSPSSSGAVWTLLPATSTMNTNTQVIELSRGMASGKLFYNLYDRSVMVKGQIIHRGSETKRATNTYNFTVSPRG